MKLTKTGARTTSYKVGNKGFMVDIIELNNKEKGILGYIYHKDYDYVKTMMFHVIKDDIENIYGSFDEGISILIENNFDDAAISYIENYVDKAPEDQGHDSDCSYDNVILLPDEDDLTEEDKERFEIIHPIAESLVNDFERTILICQNYENKNERDLLINEVGVLRGLYYALEKVGINLDGYPEHIFDEFERLIKLVAREQFKS